MQNSFLGRRILEYRMETKHSHWNFHNSSKFTFTNNGQITQSWCHSSAWPVQGCTQDLASPPPRSLFLLQGGRSRRGWVGSRRRRARAGIGRKPPLLPLPDRVHGGLLLAGAARRSLVRLLGLTHGHGHNGSADSKPPELSGPWLFH